MEIDRRPPIEYLHKAFLEAKEEYETFIQNMQPVKVEGYLAYYSEETTKELHRLQNKYFELYYDMKTCF